MITRSLADNAPAQSSERSSNSLRASASRPLWVLSNCRIQTLIRTHRRQDSAGAERAPFLDLWWSGQAGAAAAFNVVPLDFYDRYNDEWLCNATDGKAGLRLLYREAAARDRERDRAISEARTRAGPGCLYREYADDALPRLNEELEVRLMNNMRRS